MTDGEVARGTVVGLDGEFDLAQKQRLAETFATLSGESIVIVDLERTKYMDSSVLSCLLNVRRDLAKSGGRRFFSGPATRARRHLGVSGLGSRVEIRESVAEICSELGLSASALQRIEMLADVAG